MFQVKSVDDQHTVGMVSKKWQGLVAELFTDGEYFGVSFPADLDVKIKAVLLGACFLIVSRPRAATLRGRASRKARDFPFLPAQVVCALRRFFTPPAARTQHTFGTRCSSVQLSIRSMWSRVHI